MLTLGTIITLQYFWNLTMTKYRFSILDLLYYTPTTLRLPAPHSISRYANSCQCQFTLFIEGSGNLAVGAMIPSLPRRAVTVVMYNQVPNLLLTFIGIVRAIYETSPNIRFSVCVRNTMYLGRNAVALCEEESDYSTLYSRYSIVWFTSSAACFYHSMYMYPRYLRS